MSSDPQIAKIFGRLRKRVAKRLESIEMGRTIVPDDARQIEAQLARQQRPKRGLPPEEALRAYSDTNDLAVVDEYSDATEHRSCAPGIEPPLEVIRYRLWRAAREKIENAHLEDLKAGKLAASAIPEHGDRREVLDSSIFDLFWIDYDFDEIVGEGRSYKAPEIFSPTAIPLNVRDVPEWLLPRPAAFEHEPDYRHVVLHGKMFVLGEKQAVVIRLLHQAYLTDNPWRTGRELLDAALSTSEHLRELMKGKVELIESDGHGHYRLNLSR